MYNADTKLRFFQSKNIQDDSMLSHYVRLFDRVGGYEEAWGGDVAIQPTERLQKVFDDIYGVRHNSKFRVAILRDYIKWYAQNENGAMTGNMDRVEFSSLPKKRLHTVANPLQLKVFLDALFEPETDYTQSNVYRAYIWLAFAGIPESRVCDVLSDDVDLTRLTVRINGREYPIYREGYECIRNCVELPKFVLTRGDKKVDYRRIDDPRLLRTIKAHPRVALLSDALRKANNIALETGKTQKEIRYRNALLSGRCYRMYEHEMAGLPIDIEGLVADIIETEGSSKSEPNRRRMRTRNHLLKDYEEWKQTF